MKTEKQEKRAAYTPDEYTAQCPMKTTTEFTVNIPNRDGDKIQSKLHITVPIKTEHGQEIITPEGMDLIYRTKQAEILKNLVGDAIWIIAGIDLSKNFITAKSRQQLECLAVDMKEALRTQAIAQARGEREGV